MVVDRPLGDVPLSVHYRGMKIVVAHATFTLEGGSHNRVSVIRGEIELHCPSGPRTVRSGGSAACEPGTEIRATPRHRPYGTSPEAARPQAAPDAAEPTATPPTVPPPTAPQPPAAQPTPAELYATAESALGRGDVAAAEAALLALVDAAPDSLDAAVALVDLARLSANRGDTGRALDYLTRLEHHPRRAWVAAPAALLLKSLARGDTIRALDPP
jgi:TolA-binding protein